MIRKIKNYLKIGITLFGVLLVFTNCQKEGEVVNDFENQKSIIIKQYHFNDLNSNSTIQNSFKKLNAKKSKIKLSSKSSSEQDLYNFTIDSSNVREVIIDNYKSYTFFIKRPYDTPNYFENLIIEEREQEITRAFIIKYIPTSPITNFEEHNSFSFEGERIVYRLNLDELALAYREVCTTVAETWCSWSENHIAGPSCYLATDGRLFTLLVDDCVDEPDMGGGGNGLPTDNGDTEPILTSPIAIDSDGNPVKFPTTASSSEGSDQLEFDPYFWSNTNLIFPQQNKPSFSDFFNAYPKAKYNGAMAAKDVFILIGGNVNSMAIENNWTNACAARVSRALNYSGVQIPNIPGLTFEGGDGKYYFLGANNLYNWMKKTFGEPDFLLNSDECGENGDGFIQSVNGHSGIYIMLPVNITLFGATGHSDIYSGFGFNIQGYFNATGGLKSANLWSLN